VAIRLDEATQLMAGLLAERGVGPGDRYSFDLDEGSLKNAYHAHREAYQRIFDRLAVRYVIVSAVSGELDRAGPAPLRHQRVRCDPHDQCRSATHAFARCWTHHQHLVHIRLHAGALYGRLQRDQICRRGLG